MESTSVLQVHGQNQIEIVKVGGPNGPGYGRYLDPPPLGRRLHPRVGRIPLGPTKKMRHTKVSESVFAGVA